MKKPRGYVVQHFATAEGAWRTLTKPVTNKKYAFRVLALLVGVEPRTRVGVLPVEPPTVEEAAHVREILESGVAEDMKPGVGSKSTNDNEKYRVLNRESKGV